jgi:hypothetical protein
MGEKEFSAYLKGVMRMSDTMHRARKDSALLVWLSEEIMERNDLTGWQRRQVYNAATSYLRP